MRRDSFGAGSRGTLLASEPVVWFLIVCTIFTRVFSGNALVSVEYTFYKSVQNTRLRLFPPQTSLRIRFTSTLYIWIYTYIFLLAHYINIQRCLSIVNHRRVIIFNVISNEKKKKNSSLTSVNSYQRACTQCARARVCVHNSRTNTYEKRV